jgi:hypothetical protein
MRRGVWLSVIGVLAAGLGVASARADGTPTTTTTGTTTTTAAPSYARLAPSYLPSGCVGAGAAAIAEPGRQVLALGTPASSRGPSAYPGKSPIVAFDSSTATGSTCTSTSLTLQSVSLFGGVVTATSIEATHGKGAVTGLVVGGSAVTLGPGQTFPVGYWGQVMLGGTVGRLTAPLVVQLLQRHDSLPAGTAVLVGFTAASRPVAKPKTKHVQQHSSTSHASRATNAVHPRKHTRGTKKHKHRKRRKPQPLKVTPPLGFKPSHYVFPIDGGASYGDTYGANRNDVYDGWHHGDDLFAPLGTPVVAVANGTLSLVGWDRLGGWRLWLTDAAGNSFYYAHLAAYSRWILDHPHVRAGQVVGFLGRTGDAFTTTPHLHFEIHPHQLLRLGYDGAVDPTAYLGKWRVVHVPAKELPRPAKLKAPVGTPAQEAAVVWHQLLVARHLLPVPNEKDAALGGASRRPFPTSATIAALHAPARRIAAVRTAAHVAAPSSTAPWAAGGLVGAILVLSVGGVVVRRRRRPSAEHPS